MKKLSTVLLQTIADELDREDAEIIFEEFMSYSPNLSDKEIEFLNNFLRNENENKN